MLDSGYDSDNHDDGAQPHYRLSTGLLDDQDDEGDEGYERLGELYQWYILRPRKAEGGFRYIVKLEEFEMASAKELIPLGQPFPPRTRQGFRPGRLVVVWCSLADW
ncbi:hypothetical protein IFR05_016127 [Cadophora sp. M221]|nr:hypothetical protein IFR05_016127 [Cadophora sp. M221]